MDCWRKQGLLFRVSAQKSWIASHAQVPTAMATPDGFRIYFSARPRRDLSLPAFIDTDPMLSRVSRLHDRPLMTPGRPGTFDEFGIMPGTALSDGNTVLLYYTGWSRGATVPYINAIGLAISHDGGTSFERLFDGPIVDRTGTEPYSTMSPAVLRTADLWHMWYSSGTDWVLVGEKYEPVYTIKHAVSADGRRWVQDGAICIEQRHPEEAITRPTVIGQPGDWHMWFCYRASRDFRGGTGSYRIGYAHSLDLVTWTRSDSHAGIAPGPGEYDDHMVAYPQVLVLPDARLAMLYNGNAFGEEGFAVAYADAPPGLRK